MIDAILPTVLVVGLCAAVLYLTSTVGAAAYDAGDEPLIRSWRSFTLWMVLVIALFATCFVLPLPSLVRVAGFIVGIVGASWVQYQRRRGLWDKSKYFKAIREYGEQHPKQGWILTGCLGLLAVVVLGALFGIPSLLGNDCWNWPWER